MTTVNRKADFLLNESTRINSHNESNRIDSNRKLECSNRCQRMSKGVFCKRCAFCRMILQYRLGLVGLNSI